MNLVLIAKPKPVLVPGIPPCPCCNIPGQGWERSWDSQEAAGGAGAVTAIPQAAFFVFSFFFFFPPLEISGLLTLSVPLMQKIKQSLALVE